MEITIKRDVTPRDIQHILISSFEGGYSPWIREVNPVSGNYDSEQRLIWWGQEAFYESDWSIEMKYDLDTDAEGDGNGLKVVTQADIGKALEIICVKYPHLWSRFTDYREFDATVADAIVQVAVLGDIVYG